MAGISNISWLVSLTSFPGNDIAFLFSFLFLFRWYKKTPSKAKEILTINAPIAIPITTGIFFDNALDCCENNGDDDTLVDKGGIAIEVVVVIAKEVVGVVCGSKLFVQIYPSLLLMSSNKISFSISL